MKTVIKTCSLHNESGLSLDPPTHTAYSQGSETVHCAQALELLSCRALTSAVGLDQLPLPLRSGMRSSPLETGQKCGWLMTTQNRALMTITNPHTFAHLKPPK